MMIAVLDSAKTALLIGYYMISVSGAAWGLIMTTISNNTLGYTKKVTVNAFQIIAYAMGKWISLQTFRADDAPGYKRGKSLVAIMYGLSAIVLVVVRWVNIRENKRRDRVQAEEGANMDNEETRQAVERFKFMDLTDFEQTYFRYVK